MKKLTILTILALLVVFLVACAPIQPAQKEKTDVDKNKTIEKNETIEPEAPAKDEKKEEKNEEKELAEVDIRDLPKKEIIEGELVSFPNLKAVDPDGDPIDYTFTAPLNEKGEWQTMEGDAGEYIVTITATDGSNTVAQDVVVVVKPKNKAPVIEIEEPVVAQEGTMFTLSPTITDPEGDELTITYTGWMTTDSREVGYEDQGLHKVVISATDGRQSTSKELIISVENTNRGPTLQEFSPVTIKEGEKVIVKPKADDPDHDHISFVYSFPLGEDGIWQTEIGDAGTYEITVTATDGELSAEHMILVTVQPVNKAPVIELETPVVVKEGETIILNPVVTDPEGDEVRITYSGWMHSNTRTTDYEDAGEYMVEITARDTAENENRLEVTIIVEDENRPPIFGAGSFD